MMKTDFTRLALMLTVLMLTLGASAQQHHKFSVQDAVEYARKNSVQVKNALTAVQIQQQTNREITAAAFPQINGSVGANHFPNVAVQQFPNFIAAATYGVLANEGVKNGSGQTIVSPADFGFIQAQFGTKFNANYGVSLQQLLFEGQVFVGLQARQASMDYANKNVEVTEEQIKANIHKIYFQLVAGRTQLELIDSNIARIRKLQNDARLLYENGFGEKIDVNRSTVQLSNIETQKVTVLNTIANGYLGLKLLMGMPIKDTLSLTDTITEASIKDGMLENMAYKYEDRKEYQLADLGRTLREYNIKRYKLTYFPTVALSSSYSRISQSNKFNFFGGANWFPSSSIGLNISIPIFDGFARSARIQRARLELQQTEDQIDALKLNIDQEVAQSLNNYKAAVNTLDNQKRNVELAEEVYRQSKLKFEYGTGGTTEITTAQLDLQLAQSNYINALYSAINARIEFLRATGKL